MGVGRQQQWRSGRWNDDESRKNFDAVGGFDEQLFVGEEIYFTQALKKLGRFTLLREPILTSGRKLRMYPAAHILSRSFGIIVRGTRAARSRDRLDLWYDGKRESRLSHKLIGDNRPPLASAERKGGGD